MKIFITLCVLICWGNSYSLTSKNVMIFMAADNNLEQYAASDLLEIQSKDYLNTTIKIQVHLNESSSRITKKKSVSLREKYDQLKNPKTQLLDFLEWAYDKDKENFLILWGHGQGPKDKSSKKIFGGVFTDSKNYQALSTKDLGHILKRYSISTLIFDMCLMQNLSVHSHLKSTANIVIGSAQVQDLIGLPYNKVLNSIDKLENSKRIAQSIVNETTKSMPNKNYTFSAFYLTGNSSISQKLLILKTEIKQLLELDPYQEFIYSTYYIDLPTFPGNYYDLGMYLGILKLMHFENKNLPPKILKIITSIQDELNFYTIKKSVGSHYTDGHAPYYIEFFQGLSTTPEYMATPQLKKN